MGWLKNLLSGKTEDPETVRKRAYERSLNAVMGAEAILQIPKSGHPKCPKCKAKHPITAEQMQSMMNNMGKDSVPLIICHTCGTKIRVQH